MLGLERADLRYGHLEVRKQFEQEGFELGVRLVDFVDQQDDLLVGGNRLHQRTRHDKALGEEDFILACNPIDGLRQALGSDQHFADLVLEDLGIEQLLGVLPFVERLALVETLVALQPDHVFLERGRQHFGQVGLADARGAFDQDRLFHRGAR